MFHDPGRAQRLLLFLAAGMAMVAFARAGVVLAGSGKAKPSPTPAATAAPAAGSEDPFGAAVEALVQAGTIVQRQADVVRRQLNAGRIDPQQWTDSGVMTAAQSQAVATRLRAVKESLAPAGRDTAPLPSPNPLKV